MITINTNLMGMMISRQISQNDASLGKSLQRLSTGLRVNSASDGAGTLGMSAALMSQIRGMNAAKQGVNDGISMLQVADSALGDANDTMQRMRELAVQASSSTASSTDRSNLNAEFQQLALEVDRIATGTTYKGTGLLTGSLNTLKINTTANSGTFITLNAMPTTGANFTSITAQAAVGTLNLSGTTNANATSCITMLDTAIASVGAIRAVIGSYQTALNVTADVMQSTTEANTALNSSINDTDVAAETANLTKQTILKQAGMAVLSQANQNFGSILSLLQKL
ncbi:MAG: flagellin FliC [Magnetococcales bacterium]|nr:flagellin FliC [Magnetococcales bacterium]